MRSLARSIRRPDRGGEPLPTVYNTFAQSGVFLRRGDVSMVAAAPGSGKSSLAVDIAYKIRRPTLYISADSAELTMATRVGSLLTGRYMFDIEKQILDDPEWAAQIFLGADHIRWVFDGQLSLEDLSLEIQAFEEVWGEPPHLIVVDNVTDVGDEGGDEFSQLRRTMRDLKFMARETNSHIMALHHTSEAVEANPCPPRFAVHGKVNQVPALILTIGVHPGGYMPIACVKNRQGPDDRSGNRAMYLTFDPAVMRLADMERQA